MRRAVSLAAAGAAATAVAFGPARMGFGLFLPTFREAFSLSSTQAGVIGSLGFTAFFLALPLAAALSPRTGPKTPILMGAAAAFFGFIVVASARDVATLALGVALGGASAGFAWTPFNDAAERFLPERGRPAVLSTIATGTTFGVAVAGALFLVAASSGLDWRLAWGFFALGGICSTLLAHFGVPRASPQSRSGRAAPGMRDAGLLQARAGALYAAAFVFGMSNAVYLSFAGDHAAAAVPSAQISTGLIFASYGVFGTVGLAAGAMEARLGLRRLLGLVFAGFAASLALVAHAPDVWAAVILSAGLHGAAVMTVSAVLSFWSLRLFPGHASQGFTAALMWAGAGGVSGPVAAGVLADAANLGAALWAASLPPAAAAVAFLSGRSLRASSP